MVPAPTSTTAPTKVPPTPTTAPSATPAAPADATINIATDPKLGKILVDGKGMALYMYTKDAADVTNCTGGCLTAWPPLLTSGSPKLGDGVDKALVGSAKMADGKMIVTYNKMPLYYYAKDTKAGDVVGQNVGGVWYVVSPEGKVVGFEATIKVVTDPKLGKILVDARGMTLYMYTKDVADKTNCAGGCLTAWPPLLTQGSPTLGEGVDKTLVGSATMADGSKIVTYNHMPLYFYAKDAKVGDVVGQNVGGVWYVVSPEGKVVGFEATLKIATDPKLGKILVDARGMTLYIYTKDTADKSNCTAGCLTAWPPLLTQGNPNLGEGIDKALVGSATLADGTKIVTYNHMPLYFYAKDTKAGDVTGESVGSVWYVIGPDGKSIAGTGSSTGY
jgi:predicted lipoprotein with Yx(FWY)xxD motif